MLGHNSHSHLCHDSFICMSRLIPTCDTLHASYIRTAGFGSWCINIPLMLFLAFEKVISATYHLCKYISLACVYMRLSCVYIGLFCVYVGLYCEYVGLFCVYIRLSCVYIRLFCVYIGLFCVYIGLCCGCIQRSFVNIYGALLCIYRVL